VIVAGYPADGISYFSRYSRWYATRKTPLAFESVAARMLEVSDFAAGGKISAKEACPP
jgi:hypothetical protein